MPSSRIGVPGTIIAGDAPASRLGAGTDETGTAGVPATTMDGPQGAPATGLDGKATAPRPGPLVARTVPGSAVETTVEELEAELGAERTERGVVINLPGDILFDFDRDDIRPDAREVLAKLGQLLAQLPDAPVAIEGHTDSMGSDTYNQDLSERRAGSVRDHLVTQYGIDGDRLTTAGFGETRPVAENSRPDGEDNPYGRQLNRRVEVIIDN